MIYVIVFKDGMLHFLPHKPKSKHYEVGAKLYEVSSSITVDTIAELQISGWSKRSISEYGVLIGKIEKW